MWEVSIILAILGTAFFMVYLSSTIDSKSEPFLQIFKAFLLLGGFIIMLLPIPVGTTIMQSYNGSFYQNISVGNASSLVVVPSTGVESLLGTGFSIIISIFTIVMFLIMIFFAKKIIEAFKNVEREKRK